MMKIAILILVTLFAFSQATPTCTDYCNNITANCNGTNVQYVNVTHCMALCAAFPVGADADTSGNTLGCRLYHAKAAATLGLEHCFHAGLSGVDKATGNPICGTQCEAYCSVMTHTAGCIGNLRGYNTYAECNATCALFPSDIAQYDATSGNFFTMQNLSR
jgi:hypothetical protein